MERRKKLDESQIEKIEGKEEEGKRRNLVDPLLCVLFFYYYFYYLFSIFFFFWVKFPLTKSVAWAKVPSQGNLVEVESSRRFRLFSL